MQTGAAIRTEPDDIPGIRGNFRLEKDDMEQPWILSCELLCRARIGGPFLTAEGSRMLAKIVAKHVKCD